MLFLFRNETVRKFKAVYLLLGFVCGYSIFHHLVDNSTQLRSDLTVINPETFEWFKSLQQNDSEITDYIRNHHLTPPPVNPIGALAFQLSQRYKQEKWIMNKNATKFLIDLGIFNYEDDGIFIECGANDGFLLSNTLDLETEYGWKGIFIEADPVHHKALKRSNRNGWIVDTCLSPKTYPTLLEMRRHKKSNARSLIPGYIAGTTDEEYPIKFSVPCFPLYSIMLSIGISSVDFFSLDIEGAELDVLKTIPFDSVVIKAWQIEACHERYEPVKKFMESKGYKEVKKFKTSSSCDQIYVLKKLLKTK